MHHVEGIPAGYRVVVMDYDTEEASEEELTTYGAKEDAEGYWYLESFWYSRQEEHKIINSWR